MICCGNITVNTLHKGGGGDDDDGDDDDDDNDGDGDNMSWVKWGSGTHRDGLFRSIFKVSHPRCVG